jgi:hypothetical protein
VLDLDIFDVKVRPVAPVPLDKIFLCPFLPILPLAGLLFVDFLFLLLLTVWPKSVEFIGTFGSL